MRSDTVSLVSPAIRTIVVAGSIILEEDESETIVIDYLPLLAIGSRCDSEGHRIGELMVWLQDEKTFLDSEDLDFYFNSWELVVCPWDSAEDATRLQPIVAKVRERVSLKIKGDRKVDCPSLGVTA